MRRLAAVLTIAALIALALFAPGLTLAQGQVGIWQNVTPSNVDLANALDCGNFGTQFVVVDPARPSDLYADFNCQGVWKSTDYGQTFSGPINTGTNGTIVGNGAAGGLAIAPNGTNPPILYKSGIRSGALGGIGFWKSTDGGVSWTHPNVTNSCTGASDFNVPVVDPYDANHLLLNGHECSQLIESTDGGSTWMNVNLASGMILSGGSQGAYFVNTGNPASTRDTWLWINQAGSACSSGGPGGLWRTADGGVNWSRVECVEHAHGTSQFYQPDATSGVVYVAGLYGLQGSGVYRSADYGLTWLHVGGNGSQNDVFGTPSSMYAGWGGACGHCGQDPSLQSAAQPGITGWANIPKPAAMNEGLATAAVTFDGSNSVIVTANWTGGLLRYVEPGTGAVPPTSTPSAAPTPTPTPSPTPVMPNPIRINAGGSAYTDTAGNVWTADTYASGGQAFTVTDPIGGTTDPTLYQTERYRNFSYAVPVSPGTYAVTLKFAELYWTAAGQRVFNVAINGAAMLTNFDIWASAGGKDVALDRTFTVSVTGNMLTVAFTGVVDNAKVDALQVAPVAGVPTPTSTPTPTPTSTPVGPTPVATPTPSCSVEAILNGVVTSYTRPAAFCVNQ